MVFCAPLSSRVIVSVNFTPRCREELWLDLTDTNLINLSLNSTCNYTMFQTWNRLLFLALAIQTCRSPSSTFDAVLGKWAQFETQHNLSYNRALDSFFPDRIMELDKLFGRQLPSIKKPTVSHFISLLTSSLEILKTQLDTYLCDVV